MSLRKNGSISVEICQAVEPFDLCGLCFLHLRLSLCIHLSQAGQPCRFSGCHPLRVEAADVVAPDRNVRDIYNCAINCDADQDPQRHDEGDKWGLCEKPVADHCLLLLLKYPSL
jgi:hypothetical protein